MEFARLSEKVFFSWLEKQNADVVCLQEIKAQEHQLDERFYPLECTPIIIARNGKAIVEPHSIANQNPIKSFIAPAGHQFRGPIDSG